jgi:hypothetical protein
MKKYCRCGQPIDVTHFWNGYVWVPDYRIPGTEVYIDHCPNCGDLLVEKELLNELEEGKWLEFCKRELEDAGLSDEKEVL